MADEINAGKTSAKYESHPEGQFVGVCVDTIDMGETVESYEGGPEKLSHKIDLVFRTGEVNAEGTPIDVSREFTLSMHEKASLRKFLEAWRGKAYSEDVVENGIPLHKLVGHPAYISIASKTSKAGRSYAVIASIFPVMKGTTAPALPPYTRAPYWEERKAEYAKKAAEYRDKVGAPKPKAAPAEDSDDNLPW